MRAKKKLAILSIAEAEIHADDIEVEIYEIETEMENLISEFYAETDAEKKFVIQKKINTLDLRIKFLVRETGAIGVALFLGRMIEEDIEVPVN